MDTLKQLLREENDRLRFKVRCNSIKGKVFSLKEAQDLTNQREKELKELETK